MFGNPIHDPLIAAPPPILVTAAVQDILATCYGLTGMLEPLGGERDRNFRFDSVERGTLLVKVAHPAEDPGITDFQSRALLHIEASDPGLPAPRIIRSINGEIGVPYDNGAQGTCQMRVLSFVPGQPMTNRAGPTVWLHAYGALVARLDAALAGFNHPADGRRLLWDMREAASLRIFLPDIAEMAQRDLVAAALDRFEAVLPALTALPTQVIHNDLNPHNVMVDPAEPDRMLGVIDFGDMVRAPRIQEVATACAYIMQPGDTPLAGPAAFLRGYRSRLALSDAELHLLPTLIATRMAMTISIVSWRARLQPENAPYIARNVAGAVRGLTFLSNLDRTAALQGLGLDERSTPHA
jgi:Ser/Thr protein kinase RdoA (MazF antagonist)